MKNLWNDKEAKKLGRDPLALRVYTSRLLGQDTSLVMHGGGNTSVKAKVLDFLGIEQEVLYIKGSGWDLATIEAGGFAAVKMDALLRMAEIKQLSDADMVCRQRAAMLNPNAPNPSVEAILHAVIPYKYVDHSHADALVTVTNTPGGKRRIEDIYGKRVLVVPYVMPGFILARKVYEMTRGVDWSRYEGIVLLNHGLFTFAGTAKESYEKHIKLAAEAEKYIKRQTVIKYRVIASDRRERSNLLQLSHLRRAVSRIQGGAVVALLKDDERSVAFSLLPNIKSLAARGTLTPDHVIRTKPKPLVLNCHSRPRLKHSGTNSSGDLKNIEKDINEYAEAYKGYFDRYTDGKLKCLDLAPRWAVWPGQGIVVFGRTMGEARIISDIVDHTMQAIRRAQGMGGWKALKEKDLFDVEYWELEQAKLAKGPKPLVLQGKIALVTGAASGIGKACVERLLANGAYVAGLDIQDSVVGRGITDLSSGVVGKGITDLSSGVVEKGITDLSSGVVGKGITDLSSGVIGKGITDLSSGVVIGKGITDLSSGVIGKGITDLSSGVVIGKGITDLSSGVIGKGITDLSSGVIGKGITDLSSGVIGKGITDLSSGVVIGKGITDLSSGVIARSEATKQSFYLGIKCDITKEPDIKNAVGAAVRRFGGLDIVISNAGTFPPSMDLEAMDPAVWEKSMQLNLTSHQRLMKEAIPYLSHGMDATIILIASKNVPAPGPGAGAYSVAKAGLTQLGRVAALELGGKGIRVNMVHPNQVFDTAIWTREVLEKRARHYGLSVEEYKTDNLLHTTITSRDVADLVCAMAGPAFAKTTGAQIPIDGGNERVI